MIEVFKAKNGLSNISGVVKFSRSRLNLISSLNCYSGSAKVRKIKRNFVNERVLSYWNKLPINVKNAPSLNKFKEELEKFKVNSICNDVCASGHFWGLTMEVLDRIEGDKYIENKNLHNEYLILNPFVVKKKFINLN